MMMERPVWAEVDLKAIHDNTVTLTTLLAPGSKLCAVVKADAYGHGAVESARAALAGGAEYLAVAIVEEAIQLKKAGIPAPVLVLGYTPPGQSDLIAKWNIEQTVFTEPQIQALSDAGIRKGKPVKVHIKVDTGMSRIGLQPEETADFAAAAAALPGLDVHGIFTHFSTADSMDHDFTRRQMKRFTQALSAVSERGISIPLRHAANTGALFQHPETHFDMIRTGISLYGLWPSDEIEQNVRLQPAMSLRSKIVTVKEVPANTSVGYNKKHVTSQTSRIATLPFGYADGYSRRLGGIAKVTVRGKRVPMLAVCMDQCMIDVTEVDGVTHMDEVLVFGRDGVSADEVAEWIGTVNYEVVCSVGKRVRRKYLNENAPDSHA